MCDHSDCLDLSHGCSSCLSTPHEVCVGCTTTRGILSVLRIPFDKSVATAAQCALLQSLLHSQRHIWRLVGWLVLVLPEGEYFLSFSTLHPHTLSAPQSAPFWTPARMPSSLMSMCVCYGSCDRPSLRAPSPLLWRICGKRGVQKRCCGNWFDAHTTTRTVILPPPFIASCLSVLVPATAGPRGNGGASGELPAAAGSSPA